MTGMAATNTDDSGGQRAPRQRKRVVDISDLGVLDTAPMPLRHVPRHVDLDPMLATRAAANPFAQPLASRAEQFATLDRVGYEAVADMLAHGVLGYEAALRIGVSPMVFAVWWDRAPADARAMALSVSAQASMVKAEVALSVAPASKEDAMVQVALAGHLQKVAAALDPAVWNAGKARPQPMAPLALVIAGGEMPGLRHIQGDVTALELAEAPPVAGALPDPPPLPPEQARLASAAEELKIVAPDVFDADGDLFD